MSITQITRRALVAFFSLFLVASMAMGQNLNLTGGVATLGGTWNVKGNVNNDGASGLKTFSGTLNLNGTTSGQNLGGASATQALSIGTLNVTGSQNVTQNVTVTVSTAFDINNGATPSYFVTDNVLNFGGTVTTTDGTFDASNASSTVNYTSGSAQTVLSSTYGGTLGLSGAGAKDLGGIVTAAVVDHTASSGALTVDENLTITGSALSTLDSFSVTASDILDVQGTGGLTVANLTSNAGTIRKTTSAGTITFSQASLTNAATITASVGTLAFSGDVTNNGASAVLSLTSTGSATFAEDLINTGGTLTFSNSGTSVSFTGTVAQAFASATYYDLSMTGNGIKTASGNITVSNDFTNSDTTNMSTHTLALGSGTTTNSGKMQFGGATNGLLFTDGTVEYNGTGGTQTITGHATNTYNSLIFSGTADKLITSVAGKVRTTGSLSVGVDLQIGANAGDTTAELAVDGDLNIGAVNVTNHGTVTVGN